MIGHIEIEQGSTFKWEYSKSIQKLVLDRIVPIPYPAYYGYALGTLSLDGDPLDIFLISKHVILRDDYVNLKIEGVIIMEDNGSMDEKLICTIPGESINSLVQNISDIVEFLKAYKSGIKIIDYKDYNYAEEVYNKSIERAENV